MKRPGLQAPFRCTTPFVEPCSEQLIADVRKGIPMSVKATSTLAAIVVASSIAGAALAADDHSDSAGIDNPDNCKIVERKPSDEKSSGNLSSSVTAGNGQVSAHSSGGHGVTVHSGNGSVSSSVTTTGSGKGSTMVTTSNGDCIIYVNPGEKKED